MLRKDEVHDLGRPAPRVGAPGVLDGSGWRRHSPEGTRTASAAMPGAIADSAGVTGFFQGLILVLC